MPYDSFQVNDFVTDPFFREWVLFSDEYSNAFWQQWTLEHPEKNEVIKQGRMLVKATHISEIRHNKKDFEIIKNQLKSKLFKKKGVLKNR